MTSKRNRNTADGFTSTAQAILNGQIKRWTANFSYQIDDFVWTTDKSIYVCKTAHTSGSTFSATNWDIIGSEVALVEAEAAARAAADAAEVTARAAAVAAEATARAAAVTTANNARIAGDNALDSRIGAAEGLLAAHDEEIITAFSTLSTLSTAVATKAEQSEMDTVQSSLIAFDIDVTATKSRVTTAESDIGILYGTKPRAFGSGYPDYFYGDLIWLPNNKLYRCTSANSDTVFDPAKWVEVSPGTDLSAEVLDLQKSRLSIKDKFQYFEDYNTYLERFNTSYSVIWAAPSASGFSITYIPQDYPYQISATPTYESVKGTIQLPAGAATNTYWYSTGGVTYHDNSSTPNVRTALLTSGKKVRWKRKVRMKIGNTALPDGTDLGVFFGFTNNSWSSNHGNLAPSSVIVSGLQFGGTAGGANPPTSTRLYGRKVVSGTTNWYDLGALTLAFFTAEIVIEIDHTANTLVCSLYFNETLVFSFTNSGSSYNYLVASMAMNGLSTVNNSASKVVIIDSQYVETEVY